MSDTTQSDLPKSSSNTHDGCDYIKENNLIYQRMADGGRFMNSSRDVTDRMLSLFNNDNQPREHKVFNNTNVYQINTAAENPDVNRKGYSESLNNIFKNGTAPWEILDFVGGTSCKPQTHLDGHDYTLDWSFLEQDSVYADSRSTLPSSWRGILRDVDQGKNWYAMTLSELTSTLTGITSEYLNFIVTYLKPRMTELMGWLQDYNNSLNGGTYQSQLQDSNWSMVFNARAEVSSRLNTDLNLKVEESLKLYDIMQVLAQGSPFLRWPSLIIGTGKKPPDLMDEIYLINRLFQDAATTYSNLTAEQCRSLCNIDDGCALTCTDPEKCDNPECTRCMGSSEYQTYQAEGCNIPSNVNKTAEERAACRQREVKARYLKDGESICANGNRYGEAKIYRDGTKTSRYIPDLYNNDYGPCGPSGLDVTWSSEYKPTYTDNNNVSHTIAVGSASDLWPLADNCSNTSENATTEQFSLYPFRKN